MAAADWTPTPDHEDTPEEHARVAAALQAYGAAAREGAASETQPQPGTTSPAAPDVRRMSRGMRVLTGLMVAALGLLILTPTALSSWSLYVYAGTPRDQGGLELPGLLRLLLPLAFDELTLLFVGMTIYAAWRYRERPGLLRVLVWLLAGSSALLQWLHSPYDPHLFAGLSLLGPLALEVALNRWRRWLRRDAGEVGYGARWLPGIAFAETLAAWRLGIREGITRPEEAVRRMRLQQRLKALPEADRIAYALGEQAGADGDLEADEVHQLRVWLADHGVTASSDAIADAVAQRAAVRRRAAQQEAAATRGQLEAAAADAVAVALPDATAELRDRLEARLVAVAQTSATATATATGLDALRRRVEQIAAADRSTATDRDRVAGELDARIRELDARLRDQADRDRSRLDATVRDQLAALLPQTVAETVAGEIAVVRDQLTPRRQPRELHGRPASPSRSGRGDPELTEALEAVYATDPDGWNKATLAAAVRARIGRCSETRAYEFIRDKRTPDPDRDSDRAATTVTVSGDRDRPDADAPTATGERDSDRDRSALRTAS